MEFTYSNGKDYFKINDYQRQLALLQFLDIEHAEYCLYITYILGINYVLEIKKKYIISHYKVCIVYIINCNFFEKMIKGRYTSKINEVSNFFLRVCVLLNIFWDTD